MALPSYSLEVAFGIDPRVDPDPGDWVEVSTSADRRFMGGDIKRGKNQELDAFEPGTFNFTLDDPDRTFEPDYSGSPYYPDVVPDTHIRLRATHSAILYDVWRGYVNTWVPLWELPGKTEVSCTDAFKYFGTRKLENPYVAEVLADSPLAYWRLNESSGDFAADSSGNGHTGLYSGTLTFSQPDPITDDVDGAVQFSGGRMAAPGVFSGTGDFTVELWFNTTQATDSDTLANQNTQAEIIGWFMSVGPTGWVSMVVGGLTIAEALTPTGFNDGEWHHVVGQRQGTTLYLYIDGVLEDSTTDADAGGAIAPNQPFELGDDSETGGGAGNPYEYDGLMDEVAIYSSRLSLARIQAHYEARNAWLEDQSGERIDKVLDQIDWPAGLRDIDTGNTTLQSAGDLGSQTALAHLQKVEESEFGALYMTRAGEVKWRERSSIFQSPYTTSQVTIGRGAGEKPYVVIEPNYDENLIRNEVKLSREGGGEQVVRESNRYFYRTFSRSGLQNQNDNELNDIAHLILDKYKLPQILATVTLNPRADDDALWPQVLGRELEDRITLKRIAPDGSGTVEKTYHIQSIEHKINPGFQWSTTWGLSPADTRTYWLAGIVGASEAGQTTRAGA